MWRKFVDKTNQFVGYVTASFLVAMVLLVFIQIFSRALFNSSFIWTDELTRYLMVWVTFLAIGYTFQYGGNISIAFFAEKLKGPFYKIVVWLGLCVSAGFSIVLLVTGMMIMDKAAIQHSTAMGLKMSYVYLVFPISAVFILINLVDLALKEAAAKGGRRI